MLSAKCGVQTVAQGTHLTCLFYSEGLPVTQPHLFVYILSTVAFVREWDTKPKVSAMWPFMEMPASRCIRSVSMFPRNPGWRPSHLFPAGAHTGRRRPHFLTQTHQAAPTFHPTTALVRWRQPRKDPASHDWGPQASLGYNAF